MSEFEDNTIREYMFNDHAKRMRKVNNNFKITRIYNVYLSAVFWVLSIISFYLSINYAMWGVITADILAEEHAEAYFPFSSITVFMTLPLVIINLIADALLIKKLNVLSFAVYLLTAGFAVFDLFTGFQPMETADILVLIIYSVLGMITEGFAILSFKELKYLSGQDGFPDFNPVFESSRNTKYTKYRDKWLENGRTQNYFTSMDKPITDYTVVSADSSSAMDGISLGEDQSNNWFEDRSSTALKTSSFEMDSLDSSGIELPDIPDIPDDDDYFDDPRHRPLF